MADNGKLINVKLVPTLPFIKVFFLSEDTADNNNTNDNTET